MLFDKFHNQQLTELSSMSERALELRQKYAPGPYCEECQKNGELEDGCETYDGANLCSQHLLEYLVDGAETLLTSRLADKPDCWMAQDLAALLRIVRKNYGRIDP